jgi:hypothetical protein
MGIEWAKGVRSGGGGDECGAAGRVVRQESGALVVGRGGARCGEAAVERGASARRAVG